MLGAVVGLRAIGGALLIVTRPAAWSPLAAIALVAALAGPGVAGAALSWSSPISVDGPGGSSLSSVACPSATLCVAVDAANREVSFDPRSPGMPTPVTIAAGVGGLAAVACASVNECTAVSKYGGPVVTFDPSSPTPSSAGSLDNGPFMLGIACPSVSQCTAVDSAGYESSFDQSMLGTFVSPVELNHAGGGPIACPSATECVVVPNTDELTFDPTTVAQGPVGQPVTISSGNVAVFGSVACPSTGQCTAVDLENHEVTFDPRAPAMEPPIAIDGAGNSMSGVACPSASQCTAVDGHGREVTFDPSAQTSRSRALAPVSIEDDNLNGKPHALNGVACPLPSQCTAVDGGGQEVTFDPQSPGAPTPVEIDPNKTVHKLGAVACPSRSQCTALDASGRAVTFDPRRRRPLGVVTIDPRAKNDASSAFACPSTKQCTATGADDFTEVTFDPRSPRTPTWFTIAQAVGGLVGVACPSVTQCTGVDAQGEEVTCDPRARCLPRWVTIEPYRLRDLACPSTIQLHGRQQSRSGGHVRSTLAAAGDQPQDRPGGTEPGRVPVNEPVHGDRRPGSRADLRSALAALARSAAPARPARGCRRRERVGLPVVRGLRRGRRTRQRVSGRPERTAALARRADRLREGARRGRLQLGVRVRRGRCVRQRARRLGPGARLAAPVVREEVTRRVAPSQALAS